MKTLFAILLLISANLYAQSIEVKSKLVDLGEIRETLGDSTRKVVLKINGSTPKEFKVKFNYKYRFTSEKLDHVFVTPSGDLSFSTRPEYSELMDNDGKISIDVEESTEAQGEEVELILEISKPNKNIHGVKVNLAVVGEKNTVSGGKTLMGILGRSYKVKALDCE